MKTAIAYTRLSKPNKKGRPGIGHAAQQAAIAAFTKAEAYDLIETFAEIETGAGYDALEKRPQLAADGGPGSYRGRLDCPSAGSSSAQFISHREDQRFTRTNTSVVAAQFKMRRSMESTGRA